MTDRNHRIASQIYRNPDYFVLKASRLRLRSYQREVLNAIVRSIREKAGRSFVVIFSRQSGKNELQAQLFTYLLAVLSRYPLKMVSVSPTFRPQCLIAMDRLEQVLSRNLFTRRFWHRKEHFKFVLGSSQVVFLSGNPAASVVGHTAHLLLSVDEAQQIVPHCFDKIFAPMAAAHNATRVFWGTAWTSDTLLARERRLAEIAQKEDGLQRLWIVPGDVVAAEVPSYSKFLQQEISHLGRNHPVVRSQYFCEEIDAQSRMFTPARLALMQPDEPPQSSPLFAVFANGGDKGGADSRLPSPGRGADAVSGRLYAFLLDVAGQDEAIMGSPLSKSGTSIWGGAGGGVGPGESALTNPGRDSVSLTIVSIDLSTLATLQAPTYRFIHREQWTGQNHLAVFGKLKSLAESWRPRQIVMDATGVGEGLWAMLDKAFPTKVIPVKFSQKVKSEIGWRYLAIIETGRARDLCNNDAVNLQYEACQSEILPGPLRILRWGVPEGKRGPDGELIHDDYLMADALVAVLDRLKWYVQTEVFVSERPDPLEGMLW